MIPGREATVTTFFTAGDCDGWAKIDITFLGKGGPWEPLFARCR